MQRVLQARIGLENDAVLVGIGEDGRDDALAVGIVERVVYRGRRDAEARGLVAVDLDIDREALRGNVAGDVGEFRQRAELVDQLGRPFGQLRRIGVLQDELVLRLGDGAFDGQVLHRLHIERDAGQAAGRVLEPLHDGRDVGLALLMRLEVDQDAAGVQRGVGAVDADEGGEAVDIGVFQDDAGELLLALRHRGIGHRLRRFRDGLDHAGVLQREEALGDHDVETRR